MYVYYQPVQNHGGQHLPFPALRLKRPPAATVIERGLCELGGSVVVVHFQQRDLKSRKLVWEPIIMEYLFDAVRTLFGKRLRRKPGFDARQTSSLRIGVVQFPASKIA